MNRMQAMKSQVDAIDTGALIRAMPELATIAVTGDDRQSWLAGMVTSDISDLSSGDGRYSLSVNKNGRIQAELWLILGDEAIYIGVRRDLAQALHDHLDTYLIMEDAELEILSEPITWWLALGPKAAAVAKAAADLGAHAGVGPLGELSAGIIAGSQSIPGFGDALASQPDTVFATPNGWKQIRIERMLPSFGVDFDVKAYPQEASLEHLTVSFNKGCYIGQEAVFMLQKRGHVAKRLVRLKLDGAVDLAVGSEISDDAGAKVGAITSSAAVGEHTFALGMVRYKHTVSGTMLQVAGQAAQVSCLSSRDDAAAC